jgi:PAS domain-containing protein
MSGLVSVGTLCDQLADLAREKGLRSLTMWLKLAANQAYLDELMTESRSDRRIGIWDWDVANNINYSNEINAALFGISPDLAVRGHPVDEIVARVHPDDLQHFQTELNRSIASGEPFHADYRVIVDSSVRWLRSDGRCSLDSTGRPLRMLGSVVDITREKAFSNVIALRR